MKSKHTISIAVILTVFMAVSVNSYEVTQGPSELISWNESAAYNGYTLFGSRGKSYLIDMEGSVVHTWNIGTNPRFLTQPGHEGNILDATKDDPSGFEGFAEMDWDGNVVWSYTESRANYAPHHDWVRIYNKKLGEYTTLYIANKTITNDEAIAAGADASNNYEGSQMDTIVEINEEGEVIWEWWFFDHVVQDMYPSITKTYGDIAKTPGRININLPGRELKKDWLHCNSLDYNEELDQIVTNSVQGEFYVIDHGNTFIKNDPAASIALAAGPAGDFLYRFGDPARYNQGDPPSISQNWTISSAGNKQIGAAHDIHWIPEGVPGAGNLLIFNNGQYLFEKTGQSYIMEINGFIKDEAGTLSNDYVNPPDAGYYTYESPDPNSYKQTKYYSNQLVWIYNTRSSQALFDHIGSGAQRLPNGNTLICGMTEGHIFEVNDAGNVVWEYVVPITSNGILDYITDQYPAYNAIFRAYRYSQDHIAFSGRILVPGGPITDYM